MNAFLRLLIWATLVGSAGVALAQVEAGVQDKTGHEIVAIDFSTVPDRTKAVAPRIGLEGDVRVRDDLTVGGELILGDGVVFPSVTTISVSPVPFEPLASGQALRDALAGIVDASASKRYVVHLEPGVYDVRSTADGNSLQMKPWVTIEGSGETVTEIRSGGSASLFEGAVETAAMSELRRLTIRNTGGDAYSIALLIASSSAVVDHVTAIASGGTLRNYGVRHLGFGNTAHLTDVVARATGGNSAYGVAVKDVDEVLLQRVEATASGATDNRGLFVFNEIATPLMTVVMEAVEAVAEGGTTASALRIDGGAFVTVRRSQLTAFGAAKSYGVEAREPGVAGELVIEGTTIVASGTESYGVENRSQPFTRLDASRVEAATRTLFTYAGSQFRVGASRLAGGAVAGTFKCVHAYDENYDALASDCTG